MAENAKIAALRKGMSPTGGASGSGPQALNFAWMNVPSAPVAPFQFRPVGKLKNPPKQTMEVVPPVNPLDLLSRNLNRQMDFYNPHSGRPNPVAVSMQKIVDNYTPPENPENAWTNGLTEHPGLTFNGDVMQQPIEDVSPGQVLPQYDDAAFVPAEEPVPVEPEPQPAATMLDLAEAYEGLYPVLTAPAPQPTPAPVVAPEPVAETVEPEPVFVEPTIDFSVMLEQLIDAEPVFEREPEPVFAPEPVVEAAPVAAEEPVVDPYIEQILALYEQLYAPVQQPQPVEEQQIDPLSLYQDWMLEVA